MRVTRQERGKVYSRTTVKPYVTTFTQPLHNYLIACIYHWYDMHMYWLFKYIDKFERKSLIPFTNRQDERCYYLTNKNKIVLDTEYGDEISYCRNQES